MEILFSEPEPCKRTFESFSIEWPSLRFLSADSKLHLVSLSFPVILNGVTPFIRAKDTVYQRYNRDHLACTISRVVKKSQSSGTNGKSSLSIAIGSCKGLVLGWKEGVGEFSLQLEEIRGCLQEVLRVSLLEGIPVNYEDPEVR